MAEIRECIAGQGTCDLYGRKDNRMMPECVVVPYDKKTREGVAKHSANRGCLVSCNCNVQCCRAHK